MNNRQDESKIRILAAAEFCFAQAGYKQTSIRQICEQANANLALVSYYFGSKENLYLKVIGKLGQETNKLLEKLETIACPAQAIGQFVHSFIQLYEQNQLFHMLLKHELSAEPTQVETTRQIVSPLFEFLKTKIISGKNQSLFEYESIDAVVLHIKSLLIYPTSDSLFITQSMDIDFKKIDLQRETSRFILKALGYKDEAGTIN